MDEEGVDCSKEVEDAFVAGLMQAEIDSVRSCGSFLAMHATTAASMVGDVPFDFVQSMRSTILSVMSREFLNERKWSNYLSSLTRRNRRLLKSTSWHTGCKP